MKKKLGGKYSNPHHGYVKYIIYRLGFFIRFFIQKTANKLEEEEMWVQPTPHFLKKKEDRENI